MWQTAERFACGKASRRVRSHLSSFCNFVQIRMGSGKEFLEESPYNSLEELWDGEIYDTFEPRQ